MPPLWSTFIPNVVVPQLGLCLIPVPQVTKTKDLGAIFQNSPNPWVQENAEVSKARSIPTVLQRKFEHIAPEMFLPVYSALACPPLKYCIQFSLPNSARDTSVIKKVQEIAIWSISAFRCMADTDCISSW